MSFKWPQMAIKHKTYASLLTVTSFLCEKIGEGGGVEEGDFRTTKP